MQLALMIDLLQTYLVVLISKEKEKPFMAKLWQKWSFNKKKSL